MRRFTGTFVLVLVTHLMVNGQVQQGKLLGDGFIIRFNDTPHNFLDKHYEDFFTEEEFNALREQDYMLIRYVMDVLTQKIVTVQLDTNHIKEFTKVTLERPLIEKLEKVINDNIKIEWIANVSHNDSRVAYRSYSISVNEKRKYKRKKKRKR